MVLYITGSSNIQ